MTIFLDCSSGISGDMLAGALVDLADHLGIDGNSLVRNSLGAAGIDPQAVSTERVYRGGLAARRFVVDDRPGFASFESIVEAVRSSSLPRSVVARVVATASRMAAAECEVHGTESEHLHELSSIDTAVDIIAVAALFHKLSHDRVVASPPALGSGTVGGSHGRLSVPPPAVAVLLRGLPTAGCSGGEVGELTTPTGAALLAEFADEFGLLPAGRLLAIGSGAGERHLPRGPNVLRVIAVDEGWGDAGGGGARAGRVELLETTIDDSTAELLADAAEELRKAGALDVWLTPALMKKGRPGHVLHVLVPASDTARLAEAVFRHTTTFGLRVLPVERVLLLERRDSVAVFGDEVRVRLGYLNDELITASPEFEDCRRVAERHNRSLAMVFAEAQAAAVAHFGAG